MEIKRILWATLIASVVTLVVALSVTSIGYIYMLRKLPSSDQSTTWSLNSASKLGTYTIYPVAIALPKRIYSHFQPLQKILSSNNLQLQLFPAIDGQTLDPNTYPLAPRYKEFFQRNARELASGQTKTNYIGHFGCTLSHLQVLKAFAQIEEPDTMLLLMEDDADPINHFAEALSDVFTHIDPQWELLILGFSSNYKDHPFHKLNDQEPVVHNLVRLHFWIGGWAYVVRNSSIARKILQCFEPISWHIDIVLAEQTQIGHFATWGCVPPLVKHPGKLRMSSWDHTQVGDVSKIKSDTNIE